MSLLVERFLSRLENVTEELEVEDFNPVGFDELSDIVRMQLDKDIKGLLSIWNVKIEDDYFILPHPEYPDIATKAVFSIKLNMTNFVFMLSENKDLIWVFGQCEGMIDIVVTEEKIYRTSLSSKKPILDQINKLSKLDPQRIIKFKKYGFLLSQSTPYHFFYDQLKNYIHFKRSAKKVSFDKSFFCLSKCDLPIDNECVYLFPTTVGNNQLRSGVAKELNENMESFIYNNAAKSCTLASHEPHSLKLWFSITGQKRSWLQQVEGVKNIVAILVSYFDDIELYVDGVTAPDGKEIRNSDDEAIFCQIEKNVDSRCKVYSLIGKDYRYKIKKCSCADVFIANAGTGCMVPLRFCKKPGVLHSNTKLFSFPDEYPSTVKKFDKRYTINVLGEEKSRADFASYHIPWQHIFNLVVEVINKVKGIEIEMLKVPSVDEVAKSYSAQESVRREKINSFYNIEQRIKPGQKSPDILREVALSFEESGEIETALKVMKKALELRPEGPFIKKKIDKYHQILQERGRKL
ncbi:hypothetical protein OR573_11980 [Halomonas sp. CH40]